MPNIGGGKYAVSRIGPVIKSATAAGVMLQATANASADDSCH